MSAVGGAEAAEAAPRALLEQLLDVVDERTRELLEHRRTALPKRRGAVIRRMLLVADVVGLALAFIVAVEVFGTSGPGNRLEAGGEYFAFALALPLWVILAKLHGLYERDEERADHSTVDDIVGVFHVVTVGAWLLFITSWTTGIVQPNVAKLISFWLLAITFVTIGRSLARAWCRRSVTYLQNTVIVGAGDVGQLIARKLLQHPEYGLHLVGFVDDEPRKARRDLKHLTLLGPPASLPALVDALDIERVVIASSNEPDAELLELVRALRTRDIQIDIVPRLYDLVGPRVGVHTIEGLPLIGLPPARLPRSSFFLKRAIDVIGATLGLILTAPLFAVIAWKVHRDSPGPVFFRQTRLGLNMQPFTALKFRTMAVDTDDETHRQYIRSTMSADAALGSNGLYKLDQSHAVTPFGRWLRKTSLDELPQLINVLRGDMSLVGPRPCIPYEVENFAPHQFERFLVPAGVTGLWQVTARAHSSFGEALDMDVAYVHGWSLGLDLRLLGKTPFQLLRQRGTA